MQRLTILGKRQTSSENCPAEVIQRERFWLQINWLGLSLGLLISAWPAVADITVLSEGFEGRFPEDNQWSVGNASGGAYWDDVNSSFGGEGTHSGSWKGYCAGSAYPFDSSEPNPFYQNNMTAYMSKSLDLTRYASAQLSFWYKIPSIETGYDLCTVRILPAGLCFGCPPDGTVLWSKDTPGSDWTLGTIDLTAYVGKTNILKFEFSSDGSVIGEGWYLDDISVTATPGPDYFEGATLISGTSGTVAGDNTSANAETGEPPNYGRTVWWKWTAPSSGCYVFDTYGSSFNTILDVYTGSSLAGLASVGHNDDWNGTLQSQVRFQATGGTTYYIRVDGYGGQSGPITLDYALDSTLPGNDNFAAATLISGNAGAAYGDNCSATIETGEPAAHGRTVWWEWSAPASGCFNFYTFGSSFDTYLEIFTGSALTNLHRLAYGDFASGPYTQVTFHADAGVVYHIRVDGFPADTGDIRLAWNPTTTAPNNDSFASAIVLTDDSGFAEGNNCNASSEVGEPFNYGRTVWWQWTAPSSGNYEFDTFGSGFDTTLVVFTGNAVTSLTRVAGNDNWNGTYQSQVRFVATATTYYIRVDGNSGAEGQILLSWQKDTTPPPNDNLSSATFLNSDDGFAFGDNANATAEPGEPDYPLHSVWWRWTASSNGCLIVNTYGSSMATVLDVYILGPGQSLINVAHNVSGSPGLLQSQAPFSVTADITYFIRVDSANQGNIQLNWYYDNSVPVNDNFASASDISGVQGSFEIPNCNATAEPGEPPNQGRTVWWRWVAPATGCYRFYSGVFDVMSSTFDSILEVFSGSSLSQLVRVAYNDDYSGTPQSVVTFHATAGSTYNIRVDAKGGHGGDVNLFWDQETSPPSNDYFSMASFISGNNGSDDTHNNCNATVEPDEPASAGGRTVWWGWTAPSSSSFVFDTFGSGFDSILEVFTGDSLGTLNLLASNDDSAGSRQSQVQFQATANVTYYIRVDGHAGDQGQILLNWRQGTIAPPPQPHLKITLSGGNVIISWPSTATNFILQQTESLVGNAVWSPVSHSVAQTAGEYVVIVPATKPQEFFRLAPYSPGALSYSRIDIDNPNPQAEAGFGSMVAVIGDVNGDGVPDFAVGAPGQTVAGLARAGAVFIFNGADHSFLREIDNPTPAQSGFFGAAISGSGANVVIGAPGQDHAYIIDPATGTLVQSLSPSGLSSPNFFGFAVSGLFVTAPLANVNGGTANGALFFGTNLVLSGGAFDRLGVTVATIQGGYLVSAPAFPANGVPHEYGTITGYGYLSLPLQTPNPVDSAFFGSRMAALGGPWVVSGDIRFGLETNFVFANGVLNRTIPGAGDFAGAGDVDGDGVPELLIVNGTNGASVLSFSSYPSVELATLDYPSTARFLGPQVFVYPGVTVTGLGDVDKDGIPDLLAGSPALDSGANQKQGRVFLFLSRRNR